MNKSTHFDVAVIGCGIFGAEIAIRAKSLGLSVSVYEANNDILSGASANNQNRLHLGFHYPRDLGYSLYAGSMRSRINIQNAFKRIF